MPNMNVPARLEKLREDLSRVANHIGEYSGIDRKVSHQVATSATEIAILGVQIAALAREVASWRPGDSDPAGATANVLEEIRRSVDG